MRTRSSICEDQGENEGYDEGDGVGAGCGAASAPQARNLQPMVNIILAQHNCPTRGNYVGPIRPSKLPRAQRESRQRVVVK